MNNTVTPSNVEDIAGTDSAVTDVTGGAVVGSGVGAAKQRVWLGRALTSAPSISVSVNASGDDIYMRLYEFSGVSTGTTLAAVIENGAEAFFYMNGADTTATILDTAVTTNGADRLALNFIAVNDDNEATFDTEAFTGMTGGTWVSGGSYGTATGTDGSIGLQYATMASAGTIDGGSLSMGVSDAWGVVGFALIPATVATSLVYNPRPQQHLRAR